MQFYVFYFLAMVFHHSAGWLGWWVLDMDLGDR